MKEKLLEAYEQELCKYARWMESHGFSTDGQWPTKWPSKEVRRRWLEWDARLKRMAAKLQSNNTVIDKVH